MSKYLAIARGFNEPDNNTPSDVIWCKVVDCSDDEVAKYEKVFTDEFSEDYEHGVDVQLIPISEIQDEWEKVIEIW